MEISYYSENRIIFRYKKWVFRNRFAVVLCTHWNYANWLLCKTTILHWKTFCTEKLSNVKQLFQCLNCRHFDIGNPSNIESLQLRFNVWGAYTTSISTVDSSFKIKFKHSIFFSTSTIAHEKQLRNSRFKKPIFKHSNCASSRAACFWIYWI